MDLVQALWCPTTPPERVDEQYERPSRRTQVLAAGYQLTPEHAPFKADTIFEQDVEVILRDGTKIFTDIFRPCGNGNKTVPAIVHWSPYGKAGIRFGGMNPLKALPGRVGVHQSAISGFEKFEGLDPADWVARDYAIINPDPRGVYDSEGNVYHFGTREGQDGYDLVEHIAALSWCNGAVSLAGNSWLGIAQWFIAAERPPHLKCIAPFEGASDLYREIVCRGGIPQPSFWSFITNVMRGRNQQEDVIGMLEKYPLMNEYWSDKRAKMENITVPAYVLASYSTCLHTFGSFRGFMEIPHQQKWLRVHPTQEWHDLYQKSTNDELQIFFDRYLKDIQNGWENTPPVRVSVINYNKDPVSNVPFTNWPIPNTVYKTFYLDDQDHLTTSPGSEVATITYQSDAPALQMDQDSEELQFFYKFEQPFRLIGSSRAVLYMSAEDATDMDVWVQIRKADRHGNILQQLNIPKADGERCGMGEPPDPLNPIIYLGPPGALRASHRAIDPKITTSLFPEHDYMKKEPLSPGEVVKLEIGLWQTAIDFEAGEQLVFKVSGHNMTLAEFPDLRGARNDNRGRHVVHVGGRYASHIVIPSIE